MDLAFWKSAIVAPVSRTLAVKSIEGSLAFYRDTLGFGIEQRGEEDAEAVLGPARIVFDEDHSMPEPAIFFFETADVKAFREAILARGATPSAIHDMNLLKIHLFEIRDPDGHTLWFGESYQHPDKPAAPEPMFLAALPEIAVDNVPVAIDYYRDTLGFEINYRQDNMGVLFRNKTTLVLLQRTNQAQGTSSAYFYIRNADELHAELKSRNARIVAPPVSHPWGLREFHVHDCEGNTLKFGQPFE